MHSNKEEYLVTVAELQKLAKKGPHITQDWILEVASMHRDEMRRRLLVNYDWHVSFAKCLDGIKEIKVMPGSAPDGCWDPRHIRGVVEQLVAACPKTWEKNCFGELKSDGLNSEVPRG
jgi:hypothetical protein